MMLLSVILAFSSVLLGLAAEDASNTLNILMPDAVANHVRRWLRCLIESDGVSLGRRLLVCLVRIGQRKLDVHK